ncbi:hypothetical protein ACTA71_001836 [Dictyostelium dimigraforme]
MKEGLYHFKNFINGEYVEPIDKKYLNNYDPSVGEVYSLVPDSNEKDINEAVKAAKEAFPSWSSKSAQERSDMLYKIANELERRLKEFAELESRDQGKTITTAATIEIPRSIYNFRFFAGAILHHQNESSIGPIPNVLNYTLRTPLGVCGLISPWNLPLYLLTWKIAPAIATGNTCVCKPSEMTPATAHLLGEVFNTVGLPRGVVNIVFGNGPNAGSPLVRHSDVPLISFTGGTKTGEIIQQQSSSLNKKLSLELGGKNPGIIFDDCKFEECVETSVRSSFSNQGEICLCTSRLYVQEGIFDRFVDQFVEKTKKIVLGNPQSEKSGMGALISEDHLKKIEYYVQLAKDEGGTILCGGKRPELSSILGGSENEKLKNGYFYEPTVIIGLNPLTSRVLKEEIFGPVVTITSFSTEQQAIQYANDVEYGLASSLWSQNVDRCHRVASKIECGICWVNCWLVRDLRTPFGGVKRSGIGREGGDHSIDFFTEQKNICIKIGN